MQFYDLAAYGEAHPGSFIFAAAVQSLERLENQSLKLLLKSDAVILYGYFAKSLPIAFSTDFDQRTSAAAVFKSITDKVLKKLQHLGFIALDNGHVFNPDQAA
jgi:hypothetical protein